MRKYIIGFIIFIVLVCCDELMCDACKISKDTVVIGSITDGIRVVRSCTLRFENTNNIDIGNCENACPGIEVDPGVTLTIDIASFGNVNVYGGYYFKEGNEYNCAGIYVPNTSTLVIDSSGKGKLVVYPFDRGSGIGGNGLLIESFQKSINCQDAGKIVIKNGKVLIQDPVEYSGFAKGAGIGGGGICNINNDVKFLYGGSLKMFHIINGEVTIMVDRKGSSCGEGAGIGGGGVANLNEAISNIQGGDANDIIIDGGKINIHGLRSKEHKGVGAIIGGGGIYNTARADIVSKGQLILLSDSKKANIYCDNCSDIYSDGSIYTNGSVIETGMQKQDIKTYTNSIKSWITKRILELGVVFSALFMLFELIT